MSAEEGKKAPDFTLPATGGRTVSRKAMAGRPFVLYFYPKADTPGCTKEACGFQEALPEFQKLGIEVIGVSPDKLPAIEKFAAKYNLTFPWPRTPTTPLPPPMGCGWRNPCTARLTWASIAPPS